MMLSFIGAFGDLNISQSLKCFSIVKIFVVAFNSFFSLFLLLLLILCLEYLPVPIFLLQLFVPQISLPCSIHHQNFLVFFVSSFFLKILQIVLLFLFHLHLILIFYLLFFLNSFLYFFVCL